MATFKQFEEIRAWQLGRELTREVYLASRVDPFRKDFSLCDQIRRACISITSNIAEGFERDSPAEFARFLSYAKGSAGEVRSQLYCAMDLGYLSDDQFSELYALAVQTSRTIAKLKQYLERQRSSSPSL